MKIILQNKSGYTWCEYHNSCFRGYIQLPDESVLRDKSAIDYFLADFSKETFIQKLKDVSGCFAIIINSGESVYAATDISRSMPLYYSSRLDMISDNSELLRQELNIPKERIDYFRAAEMFDTSYIVHENTIYPEIKQIELGTMAEFKNGDVSVYHYFIHSNAIQEIDINTGIKELDKLSKEAFSRLMKVVGERQIVLSLSGGYDSRYVACNLKNAGAKNVLCYTYGKKESFEVIQSEKVAEALGFDWVSYEYTDSDIMSILSEENVPYFDYCNGHDYTIYLQNFIAVKKLSESGLVDKNAVFVTGLCNDMPTGFYVPDYETALKYGFTDRGCANYIADDRFVRFKLSDDAHERITSEIVGKLNEFNVHVTDYNSFYNAVACLFTGYNHSRAFLNMNRCHEYFGHEWLIPCWDKNLLLFWYSVPLEFRYQQKLYEEYICNHLANEYGIGTKKYINIEGKTNASKKIKRKVGGVLVRVCYPMGIPIRRKRDINNFAPLEVELYKRIKQKNAVKPERAAIILLLTCYLMEQRYGTDWFAEVKKFLKL